MAVHLGGALGRLPHGPAQLVGQVVLAAPVEAQAAAGEVDVGPVAQLDAAVIDGLLDLLGDLIHPGGDDFGHLVAGEGAGLLPVHTGDIVGFALGGNAVDVLPLDLLLGVLEGNIQAHGQIRRDVAAADLDGLVEDQRVALHRHDLGVQVADVDEHGGAVAILLGQVQHGLARGGGIEAAGRHADVGQAVGDFIHKELVRHHEGDHRAELPALHAHGLQGLLAVVHHKPRGAGMNDDARHAAQALGGLAENLLHVARIHPGIGALQGHPGLRGVHLCEGARHAHVDLPQLAVALLFRLADGQADLFIQLARIVPPFLQIAVIHRDTGAHNVAALAAAVFGDQGHDLARPKVDSRYRGLHRFLIPPVSRATRPSDGPQDISAQKPSHQDACPALMTGTRVLLPGKAASVTMRTWKKAAKFIIQYTNFHYTRFSP